ncbi:MAG: hypothetical protein IT307_05615 [Chloroflexi bacterium]|nr:hypothetical protein [Chloroflexota bacterium]
MAQRIQGIADEEAGPVATLVFQASDIFLGRTANLTRIIAHSPGILKWWMPFIAAVRQPNAGCVSDVRLRNMAVLKTSTLNACNY